MKIKMLIGGLQKFSLLDYPGRISAIIFTQGCNFRCRFCYNPMLVWPASAKATAGKPAHTVGMPKSVSDVEAKVGKSKYQKDHPQVIKEDDLFVFLKSRQGKIDAVVITGGEPCLQKDLADFIRKIKELGFLVKLDTNGSYPEKLAELLKGKLLDYLAMDLKASTEKYEEVAGVKIDFDKIKKSVKIIMRSGLPYEFRTTVVPGLLNQDDIAAMGEIIKGAPLWYLQNFKSNVSLLAEDLRGRVPYNQRQMEEMRIIGSKYAKKCEVR